MSHSPPVPEANQSPYPLHEPKHDHSDLPPKPALPVGLIGAMIGLGAVAVGGAIINLRLWGAKPKPKPKRRARKKRA